MRRYWRRHVRSVEPLLRRVHLLPWADLAGNSYGTSLKRLPDGQNSDFGTEWLAGCAIWQDVTDTVALTVQDPESQANNFDGSYPNHFCAGQSVDGAPGVRRVIPGFKAHEYTKPASAGHGDWPDYTGLLFDSTAYGDTSTPGTMAYGADVICDTAGIRECLIDWESAFRHVAEINPGVFREYNFWINAYRMYSDAGFSSALGTRLSDTGIDFLHYPSRPGDSPNGEAICTTLADRVNPRFIANWPNSQGQFTNINRTAEEILLREISEKYVFPWISPWVATAPASVIEPLKFVDFLAKCQTRDAPVTEVVMFVPMSNWVYTATIIRDAYAALLSKA